MCAARLTALATFSLLTLLGCNGREGPNFGGTPDPSEQDEDKDGYFADSDCDDDDAEIYPGATERCDGVDNDCDDEVDEENATDALFWYDDADGDGFGDIATGGFACYPEDGQVSNADDCDDTEDDSYPGNVEICDDVDNDCNDEVDDNPTDPSTWYADRDHDDYGDPNDALYACDQPQDFLRYGTDCDDTNPDVNPGEFEVCDGVDNNCDGFVDDASLQYADADADGYGDPRTTLPSCDPVEGYVDNFDDCDDADSTINPDATEVCDGLDNNCDGGIDEDRYVVFEDADADGYGDDASATDTCEDLPGYVFEGGDCDDASDDVYPEAPELADGLDNDCDGSIDEDISTSDADGDGYAEEDGDCDDTEASVNPGASEICNDGLDNDCDSTDNGCTLDGDITVSAAPVILSGVAASDHAGNIVADGGDIDGDGLADLLIGAPDQDGTGTDGGAVYAVFGEVRSGSLTGADAKILSEAAGDQLGQQASGGDLDGDGFADLALSAYLADPGGTDSGAAYLLFGPVTGSTSATSASTRFIGEAASDHAGFGLGIVGDTDGDGAPELVIGANSESTTGYNAGAAYLISSGLSGDVDLSRADLKLIGAARGDGAGITVSGAGDTDGDGVLELLIAATGEDTAGSNAGAVYLADGNLSGTLSLATASVVYGEAAGDTAGCAIHGGMDLNGDGYDDALIGAEYADGGASDGGAAYVIYGPWASSSGLGSADAALLGGTAKDRAGHAVGATYDLDLDGSPELLVGAIYEDSGAKNGGTAYLFYSAPTGSVALSSADVLLLSETDADRLGRSVAGLGDTDGDGAPDLAVGAHQSDRGATDSGAVYLFYGGGL